MAIECITTAIFLDATAGTGTCNPDEALAIAKRQLSRERLVTTKRQREEHTELQATANHGILCAAGICTAPICNCESPAGGWGTLDPAEQLLTTETEPLAWPLEQVVAEMSQAAQVDVSDMKWQEMTGKKTLPQRALKLDETPSLESSDSAGVSLSLQPLQGGLRR